MSRVSALAVLFATAVVASACREAPPSASGGSAAGRQVSASPVASDTTASATAANARRDGVTRTDSPKEMPRAVLEQQLADAKKLAGAMEAYASDHGGKYPSAADMAGLQEVLVPRYLAAAPQTPFDVSSTPDGYTINTITGTRLLSGHR